MKARIFLLIMLFFAAHTVIAQQLTYKITNPKISHVGGSPGHDNFEFNIQVKASAIGTYLWAGQWQFSFDNTSLSPLVGDWSITVNPPFNGFIIDGVGGTTSKYTMASSSMVSNLGTSEFYFTITGNTNSFHNVGLAGSNGGGPTDDWVEVTTSYQSLCTVRGRITGSTGAAGVNFHESVSNGQQQFISGLNTATFYTNPNLFDPSNFNLTYLGRVYANSIWSQSGGTTNGTYLNWATAVNTSVWDGAATIPSSGSSLASAVRIHSGATLTIPSTGTLTATNLENNTASGLTIQSTSGSATGSLVTTGTVSGAGTAVVERWMTGDIWHLISPAVTGEGISTFTGSGNSVGFNSNHFALAPYDVTSDTWTYYPHTSPTGTFDTPGKGYQILRTTGTPTGNGTAGGDGVVTFTGALAAAGVTSPITTGGYSWNLIGNPYPCGLNIADFITANSSLIDPIYQFMYVSKVGDLTTYGYDAESSRTVIPPGEGFFIKSSSAGTVNFTTSMKRASSDAFKAAVINFPTINLSAETATDKMSTTVNYISGMTNGLDPGYDAGLFNGGGLGSFSLSTRLVQDIGVDFQIQCLPDNNYENMVVPVGLVAASGSAVTFKAVASNIPSDLKVVLEDRVNNTFTRLDNGGTYTVTLNTASAGPGRFFLRTATIVSDVPGDLTVELKVVALPNQQIIQVYGNVNLPARALVYDMNGKLMTTKVLTGADPNEIPLVNAANGIYLLKIESNKTPLTQKIRWIRD